LARCAVSLWCRSSAPSLPLAPLRPLHATDTNAHFLVPSRPGKIDHGGLLDAMRLLDTAGEKGARKYEYSKPRQNRHPPRRKRDPKIGL
jgi:hypothetical protein